MGASVRSLVMLRGVTVSEPRVLLIDEDVDHRRHCARVLRAEGFDVVESGGAGDEVDAAVAECAAALLDDGARGLAGRVRSAGGTVFGMTDIYLGDLNREVAIVRDGFAEFWEKPVSEDALVQWLRRALGERYPRRTREAPVSMAPAVAPPTPPAPVAAPPAPVSPRSASATPVADVATWERIESSPRAVAAGPPPRRAAATTTASVSAVPPRPNPVRASGSTPRVETPIPRRMTSAAMPRVDGGRPDEARRSGEPVVPRRLDVREVQDAGEFVDHAFPTVLASLAYRRATGALMLQHEADKRLIYLEDGFAVGGRTNRESDGLGVMVVEMGLVSAASMRRIEAKAHELRLSVAQVLVEERVFSPDEMDLLWSVNLRNRALDIFDWAEGIFSFREGSTVPPNHRHDPVLSPMDMIWEGIQHGTRLRTIRAELEPFQHHALLWANDPPEPGTIRLTPSQEALTHRIDERTSMSDLAREGRLTPDVQRFVYALLATGFLALLR